jgi:type I restriction enzyme S subunit
MKVEWKRLDDVVSFARTPVEIQPDTEYARIGIYSWGNGHFVREATIGPDMGMMAYFEFSKPSLVFSNIQAWEGAVALVHEQETSVVASSRFYPYVPRDEAEISLRFLFEFFRSTMGRQIMRNASSGTQVRNKLLSRARIEAALVPVPSLAQQDRIADHLNSLERKIAGNFSRQARNAHTASEAAWIGRFRQCRLSDLVEIGPSPKRLAPDSEVAFVPMSAVSAKSGTVDNASYRSRNEVGGGYRQFRTGDIIFARITPSMQNGKSAIFDDMRTQIGYGSTEFHVLRPYRPETTVWLWAILRTRWFRELAAASFTGTAGQQRVPAAFLENALVPLPDDNELVSASDRLVSSQETLAQLESAETKRNTLAAAILPAARNEIFAAMH